MSHTITVTVEPTEESDDYEWELGGTHDNTCDCWWECLKVSHRHPSAQYGDENEDWATKRTPELHKWIDGMWMIQRGCGYYESDHGQLYFDLLHAEAKVGDTYEIDVSWDGDNWNADLVGQR